MYTQLNEMANLNKNKTGLEVNMYISPRPDKKHKEERLKFQNNTHNNFEESELIPIGIDDNDTILNKFKSKIKISNKILKDVKKWISGNSEVLLKFWNTGKLDHLWTMEEINNEEHLNESKKYKYSDMTFREYLKEAEEKDIQAKLDKLKIQLDDANHALSSHKKMKTFDVKDTESSNKWNEKLETIEDKIKTIKTNIEATENQLRLAKEE